MNETDGNAAPRNKIPGSVASTRRVDRRPLEGEAVLDSPPSIGASSTPIQDSTPETPPPPPPSQEPPPPPPLDSNASAGLSEEPGPGDTCVFIGPSTTGKTTLMAAMLHAARLPPRGSNDTEFLATPDVKCGNSLAQISTHILQFGTSNPPPATNDANEMRLGLIVKTWPEVARPNNLHLVDSPGGWNLPAKGQVRSNTRANQELLERAREAQSLIICMDLTNPEMVTFIDELSITLHMLRRTRSDLITKPTLWHRLLGIVWPQPLERSSLAAKRVLLLLCKGDIFAENHPKRQELKQSHFTFLQNIDPVQLAFGLVGRPMLYQIRQSMQTDAIFSVGIVSSFGFHGLTGEPFLAKKPTEEHTATDDGFDYTRLRDWRPYGVREALIFLTTGKAEHPLRIFQQSDFYEDPYPVHEEPQHHE